MSAAVDQTASHSSEKQRAFGSAFMKDVDRAYAAFFTSTNSETD